MSQGQQTLYKCLMLDKVVIKKFQNLTKKKKIWQMPTLKLEQFNISLEHKLKLLKH